MTNRINAKRIIAVIAVLIILICITVPRTIFASSPTDLIHNYQIIADVNDDATVSFQYHLEWEVLESDGIGPVNWVYVGIPNGNYVSYGVISDNIKSIEYSNENGISSLEIYFTKSYYKGEIINFDFYLTEDYMYEMNAVESGKTQYIFTPGWFDEIEVENIQVLWNANKVSSFSPSCLNKDGYLCFETSLDAGDTMTVTVTYPNDAFAFDSSKYIQYGDKYEGDYSYNDSDTGDAVLGLFSIIFWFLFIRGIVRAVKANKAYDSGSGLGSKTEKKVTRTKIEYYPTCQGCGATRKDGETNCSYCGRSFIKSEEVLTEEEIEKEDKDALKYDKSGEYHYSSSPNTFVRVNVVHVPVSAPRSSGGHTGRSGGGRSGGGCAHSSCACACASCACACACACAGGGRAGCTTKDFYNTNLKLTQLELKKKETK